MAPQANEMIPILRKEKICFTLFGKELTHGKGIMFECRDPAVQRLFTHSCTTNGDNITLCLDNSISEERISKDS